jgi:hypothetical protein
MGGQPEASRRRSGASHTAARHRTAATRSRHLGVVSPPIGAVGTSGSTSELSVRGHFGARTLDPAGATSAGIVDGPRKVQASRKYTGQTDQVIYVSRLAGDARFMRYDLPQIPFGEISFFVIRRRVEEGDGNERGASDPKKTTACRLLRGLVASWRTQHRTDSLRVERS